MSDSTDSLSQAALMQRLNRLARHFPGVSYFEVQAHSHNGGMNICANFALGIGGLKEQQEITRNAFNKLEGAGTSQKPPVFSNVEPSPFNPNRTTLYFRSPEDLSRTIEALEIETSLQVLNAQRRKRFFDIHDFAVAPHTGMIALRARISPRLIKDPQQRRDAQQDALESFCKGFAPQAELISDASDGYQLVFPSAASLADSVARFDEQCRLTPQIRLSQRAGGVELGHR